MLSIPLRRLVAPELMSPLPVIERQPGDLLIQTAGRDDGAVKMRISGGATRNGRVTSVEGLRRR